MEVLPLVFPTLEATASDLGAYFGTSRKRIPCGNSTAKNETCELSTEDAAVRKLGT